MEENTIEKKKQSTLVELFDWMINIKTVRGSKKNDQGLWMSNSDKPKYFCPQSRIVELEDGKQFLIKRENSCKALQLDKESEKLLNTLPIKKYNTI